MDEETQTGKAQLKKPEREITVGLVDLKVLVETMFEKDVRRQSEVMVLTQPGNSDLETASVFEGLVSEVEPAARQKVGRDYRRLREALESGDDVGPALKAFLRRD